MAVLPLVIAGGPSRSPADRWRSCCLQEAPHSDEVAGGHGQRRHPTDAVDRFCCVLLIATTAVSQPTTSATPLRVAWPAAKPLSPLVRRSMALRRLAAFRATPGVTS
jgi:hypothetical protein